MDECELIYFVTTIACAISKCCPANDITLLAVIFTQLGDTLATVMAKRELLEDEVGNKSKNIAGNKNINAGNNRSNTNNNQDDNDNNNLSELDLSGMNYKEIISTIIDQYKRSSSSLNNSREINKKDE